ncbi:MAG: hypothetical protein ACTSXX_13080 [Candidatus Baldrarchaeia archaeon]
MSDFEERGTICALSSHAILLLYMLLSRNFSDPILLSMLFLTGTFGLGFMAASGLAYRSPQILVLAILLGTTTYFSSLFLANLVKEVEHVLRWMVSIAFALGSTKNADRNTTYGITAFLLINMILNIITTIIIGATGGG